MASPQVEDGHVKIADGLFIALYQYSLGALERRVLDVVIFFTYRAGLTKAEISIEDIQNQINGGVRPNRIQEAMDSLLEQGLIFKQPINQHRYILGVQKDFERWGGSTDLSGQNVRVYKYKRSFINTNTTSPDELSALPETASQKLVKYCLKQLGLSLTGKIYMIEVGRAKKLLALSARLTQSPVTGAKAIKDFFDELNQEEWFKGHVQFPVAYMLTRFERWYKSIPAKPKSVRENEAVTGKPFKYNVKTKQWEISRG